MAAIRAGTLSKVPRRMRCQVISANQRSTRFNQPGTARGDEVQMEPRVARQPAAGSCAPVGAGVIKHHVQRHGRLGLCVEALEKFHELPRALACVAFADNHAVEHAQRGEQRGGAVTAVVVRLPLGQAPAAAESVACGRAPECSVSRRRKTPPLCREDSDTSRPRRAACQQSEGPSRT